MPSAATIAEHVLPPDHTAEPAAEPARGGAFTKGRSGNPRGRPSRAHQAAWVGQYKIDRSVMQVVDDAIMRARGNDKPMLRACLERLVPPRREPPVWLNIPPIATDQDVKAALRAIANGVAQGDIPPAQGQRLVQMYTRIYRYL